MVDPERFNPSSSDYHATDSFMRSRKGKLEGIFTGDVIRSCFDGEAVIVENHKSDEPDKPDDLVMMVGEMCECYFGLLLDPENRMVVGAHVLQVNPVQAKMHGPWTKSTIERMQAVSKQHEGKVWNAHKDPRIGNKSKWTPDGKYDDREYK